MLLALILLLLSGCFVVYTYVGYGKVLQLLSSGADRCQNADSSPLTDAQAPPIAILICAHNEEQRIAQKLDNCLSLDYPADKLRIVVVSDGSTDKTEELVRQYSGSRVTLVVAPKRQGKAACLNLGMQQIDEEFVVMLDVRQSLSQNAARELVGWFRDPVVGAVSGKLQFEKPADPAGNTSFGKGVSQYWKHETQLRRKEAEVHSVIGVTGAIYALRTAAFRPIPPGTILDDVLIPMNAVLDGYRVRFAEQAVAFDQASSHPEQEKKRKIRTLAGNFQLLKLRPELLNRRKNPVWWMFVSHKVLRLFVPVALLVALLASAALYQTHWLFTVCFWGQVGIYAISLIPENTFRYLSFGILRTARTFVHMHWYIVLGFREYLANSDVHIWDVSSHDNGAGK